ncbi:LysM domain-containing protein [Flexibacter flexilis DSM 6793]|uniref:LysM domain-containing protein n=1 Tax=Flexibacter flexilis DSM 6793 TaxID=927664 RepID=A0A1I1GWR1_9BACT|nr:LysM peptidoglycan-binding domain-containing protein [Flexibacter flexilis]SFC15991.1 LysM domain-containing protein [Flexibacter flexilis DSM 6793]
MVKFRLAAIFLLWMCIVSATQARVIGIKDSVGVTKINEKLHVRYMVSPGETIYRISTKFQVAVTELLEVNPELENGLKTGQIINIPYYPEKLAAYRNKYAASKPAATTPAPAPEKPKPAPAPTPTPAPAEKAVAATEKPITQPAATTPAVAPSSSTPQTDANGNLVHTVQAGETIYSLSKKYGIAPDDIKRWNNWDLKVGQQLIVQKKETTQATTPTPAPVSTPTPEPAKKEPVKTEITLDNEPFVEPSPKPTPQETQVKKEAAEDLDFAFTGQYDKTPDPSYPNDGTKRVLIIPFDPYLYFSDADEEIAARSKIPRPKVRQYFRRRLDALLDPKGYETIHLLGGTTKDTLLDLNRIYNSLSYSYQDLLYNPESAAKRTSTRNGMEINAPEKTWVQKQKEKFLSNAQTNTNASIAKDESKYFGVKIKDPEFFNFFNNKYGTRYYVFINQFEVKTDYEHCLDRARQDYERNFIVHFSIFNSNGKQIAGNRVKIYYNSNSNSILQIVGDNMQKMADAILSELPAR